MRDDTMTTNTFSVGEPHFLNGMNLKSGTDIHMFTYYLAKDRAINKLNSSGNDSLLNRK